jgi:predicted nicotinamide N-methyase
VLENLRHNIKVNAVEDRARVEELDWEDVLEQDQLADVVLGADIVYDSRIIPALVATLIRLLSQSGVAYIVSTIRNSNSVVDEKTSVKRIVSRD